MKANDVYRMTIKFVWMKLALGGCAIVFSIVLGLILLGIAALSRNGGLFGFSVMIWLLASGAVMQINRTLNIVGNFLEKVPGMDSLVSFAKAFVNIALGNVDECCMAYTFYHEEQSAFKSAADGVVVYFQKWKTILKDALKTAVIAVIVSGVAWFFLMAVIIGVLSVLGMPGTLGFLAALLLTVMIIAVVKSSILDSYTMVCMVCSYLQVAPTTEITFDLYDKLCKLSSKFKSLLRKAGEAA